MKALYFALSLTLLLFAKLSFASCAFNGVTSVMPMPLQAANITVGADAAIGTVVLKQTYNQNFQPDGVIPWL